MEHQLRHATLGSIRLDRRDVLEGDHVSRDSCEALVPEPLGCSFVARDAAALVRAHLLTLLLATCASELLGEARANDDHVDGLELDALLLRYSLNGINSDCVVAEGTVIDAVLLCSSQPSRIDS